MYINRLINKGFRRANVRKVSINRIMANTAIANDLDQELFSELVEPLVQALLIQSQSTNLFPNQSHNDSKGNTQHMETR